MDINSILNGGVPKLKYVKRRRKIDLENNNKNPNSKKNKNNIKKNFLKTGGNKKRKKNTEENNKQNVDLNSDKDEPDTEENEPIPDFDKDDDKQWKEKSFCDFVLNKKNFVKNEKMFEENCPLCLILNDLSEYINTFALTKFKNCVDDETKNNIDQGAQNIKLYFKKNIKTILVELYESHFGKIKQKQQNKQKKKNSSKNKK